MMVKQLRRDVTSEVCCPVCDNKQRETHLVEGDKFAWQCLHCQALIENGQLHLLQGNAKFSGRYGGNVCTGFGGIPGQIVYKTYEIIRKQPETKLVVVNNKWDFFKILDKWINEENFSSGLPEESGHFHKLMEIPIKRRVVWLFEHLGSRPSWQCLHLLRRSSTFNTPDHHAGKFYHQVVDALDYYEKHKKYYEGSEEYARNSLDREI